MATDPGLPVGRGGYRLTIDSRGVELIGRDAEGAFHGLQTVVQLVAQSGDGLPACVVEDWPEFTSRGFLLDVTRGRVPTLAFLYSLVDRMVSLKLNQLQLYLEHAFVYSFDPEICGLDEGMTPDEVAALDAYCQDRFVELIPAIANLGHMGNILSRPRYRHLAEVESDRSWSDMSWPERARGLTLDCVNPEGFRLVERMFSDLLAVFRAPVVNICGDEPWDLGKGRNRALLPDEGAVLNAYLGHVRRVQRLCASQGRGVRMWSDVILRRPELLANLDPEIEVLHWGYTDDADAEAVRLLTSGGRRVHVCPGTSGWKRTLNAFDLAERNVSRFASAGAAASAHGLLNTDWGDHGHFNFPSSSYHGLALGAAAAWRSDHPTGSEFDVRFSRWAWGLDAETGRRGMSLLRAATRPLERHETWPVLWRSLGSGTCGGPAIDLDALSDARDGARQTQSWCQTVASQSIGAEEIGDLSLACEFTILAYEKLEREVRIQDEGTRWSVPRTEGESWAKRLEEAAERYKTRWVAQSKTGGLADIVQALERAVVEMRAVSGPGGGLRGRSMPTL